MALLVPWRVVTARLIVLMATTLGCVAGGDDAGTTESGGETAADVCQPPGLSPDALVVAEVQRLETDAPPVGHTLVDLDLDGQLDVLLQFATAPPAVAYGDVGGFAEPVALGFPSGARVVAADTDGDGVLDLLAGVASEVWVRLGAGRDFGDAQVEDLGLSTLQAVAPADVRGDGRAALVLWADDGVHVHEFAPGIHLPLEPSSGPAAVVAADLDGDGRDEVIVGRPMIAGFNIAVWDWGDAAPAVVAEFEAGGTPEAIRVADVTADEIPDVLVATTQGSIVVAPGDGQGGFGPGIETKYEPRLVAIAVADLDCDDHRDVVTVDLASGAFPFAGRGFGDGRFADAVPLPGAAFAVEAGDVDGDGDDEVVALDLGALVVWDRVD